VIPIHVSGDWNVITRTILPLIGQPSLEPAHTVPFGAGARLGTLLLHDDALREYANWPALGLSASKIGTFTQALYDDPNKSRWAVISMKTDWKKRIFAFDQMPRLA
jgi:hypothetical protein